MIFFETLEAIFHICSHGCVIKTIRDLIDVISNKFIQPCNINRSRVHIPIDVIFEFIVASKHDYSSEGYTQGEKHLACSCRPYLQQFNPMVVYRLRKIRWFRQLELVLKLHTRRLNARLNWRIRTNGGEGLYNFVIYETFFLFNGILH